MIALALLLATAPTADERLAAGEVLVEAKGDIGVTVRALIEAPPERVWDIVRDCANYKKTMPGIAASEQLKDEGNVRICKVTADLPFPLPDLVSVTRAEMTVEPPNRWRRTWRLLDGDYDQNEGLWLLERTATGQTLATYTILARPKIPLPESVVRRAQESKLPDMMRNIRKIVAPPQNGAPAAP